MGTKYYTAYVAISVFGLLLLPAVAAPVTEREKQDCLVDYKRYCSDFALESESLRECMSHAIWKLSNVCVDALVDAREMTRTQVDQLRRGSKYPHRATHKRSHKRPHKKAVNY